MEIKKGWTGGWTNVATLELRVFHLGLIRYQPPSYFSEFLSPESRPSVCTRILPPRLLLWAELPLLISYASQKNPSFLYLEFTEKSAGRNKILHRGSHKFETIRGAFSNVSQSDEMLGTVQGIYEEQRSLPRTRASQTVDGQGNNRRNTYVFHPQGYLPSYTPTRHYLP